MERKMIVCPKCNGMLEVTNPKQEDVLLIQCPNPVCGAKMRLRFDTGETVLAAKGKREEVPGYVTYAGQRFELQEGCNTVGRSCSKHEAQIELPTDDRSVSRQHCLIEAIRTKTGRMKVVVSDLRSAEKTAQRPIMVSDEPMAQGDRLVLEEGDTLTLGGQTLHYHQS